MFQNLGAGVYTMYYIDTTGCQGKDTLVMLNSFIDIQADFTVVPNSGSAPLNVQITNTSQNATGYQWSLDSVNIPTPPTIFDTSGTYQIQLIAWNSDPHCADTVTKTVSVHDSLIVQIPNIFTPNNDGVNDIYSITSNLQVQAKIYIFNRWGNEVFVFDKILSIGANVIWDGKMNNGLQATEGVYFYKAAFSLKGKNIDCTVVKCKMEESGFITVIK